MSWAQVDFSLVRYSPVEGTHYFYDPAHPTSIQFLLNGNWESWDIGYVKYKAQDPDVRRIAAEAEARVLRDGHLAYRQWPSEPPPASLAGFGARGSPHASVESPLPSPGSLDYPSPSPQTHLPTTGLPRSVPVPSTPQAHEYPTPASPTHHSYTTTPYGPQPPPQNAGPAPILPVTSAPSPSVNLPPPPFGQTYVLINSNNLPSHAAQPPSSIPPPQVVAPPPIVLSRNRETKILLSLDGDGIRGLSQVLLVESLVNAVCSKVGAPIEPYQIFDLFGGCSMGGVLALLLGRLRMQAHSAREAYKLIAKEVFPNKRDFFTSFDPHAPPVAHDGQAVEDAVKTVVTQEIGNLEQTLYDTRPDSADVFVVSTRIDIGTNKAALMRSYQTRRITGPEIDANMTVWEAMRGACIAPRYFERRNGLNWRPVIEPGVVDHGTAKNNPIRDILYECRKLYRYANDLMIIVSIGSGQGFDPNRELPEMAKSVHDRVIEGGVWGEKFEQDHHALMERGWMKYFRFNVPDLQDVPLEEWCHEEKIKEKTLAYLARPDVGAMFYACVDAITAVLVGGQ
ncbi:FabD/lysophospholipase-like protein, partial [Byssothecium circinans]